jgi:hypothetical protein
MSFSNSGEIYIFVMDENIGNEKIFGVFQAV